MLCGLTLQSQLTGLNSSAAGDLAVITPHAAHPWRSIMHSTSPRLHYLHYQSKQCDLALSAKLIAF